MNDDVADGLLLDLHGVTLGDLLIAEEDVDSGLMRALDRILDSNVDSCYNSFNSSI
jgi:hypothetical protein